MSYGDPIEDTLGPEHSVKKGVKAQKQPFINSEKNLALETMNGVSDFIEKPIFYLGRLLWNIFVTGLIIGGFVLWFGFIFGSVIAVVLILIFAPEYFLLPLTLSCLYKKL